MLTTDAAPADAVRRPLQYAAPFAARRLAAAAGASAALRGACALFTAALLVTLGGACAPGEAAGEGGTTYDGMPRLALTRGTAFCARPDADGCQFVDILVAAVGPDGRVALGGMGGELSQFDSTGRFVRRLGRRGSGPGEYRSVGAMTYDSSATLTLFDVPTRLVRFDSAGGPLATSRVELAPGSLHAAFARGRLVFAVLPGAAAIGDPVDARFVAVDSAGAATAVLGHAPAHALGTGDGSLTPPLTAFAARPQWGIGRNGALYFAEGGALHIVRADGDAPRTIVDMDVTPPPVTAAELDSARELMLRARAGRMPPEMARIFRQQAEDAVANAAAVHPMIGALAVLDHGTLWARETSAAVPDSIRWNGFGADGRPLGYILLPVRARILAGERDRLLVVTYGADDVPGAAWWRVER